MIPDPHRPSILHVVDHALPRLSGYAVRSHEVCRALRSRGIPVAILPGERQPETPLGDVDGVTYLDSLRGADSGVLRSFAHAAAQRGLRGSSRLGDLLDARAAALRLPAPFDRPGVVHVHSPPRLFDAARPLATRLGAPLVYEVRGIWALSAAAEEDRAIDPLRAAAADAFAARAAEIVFAICRGLADLLIAGGVDARRVHLAPNGVDAQRFRPRPRDAAFAREIGLDEDPARAPAASPVFGYATNVRRFEGVEDVLAAWPSVLAHYPGATFLLAGHGPLVDPLRDRARAIGIENRFRVLGPVPVDRMPSFYSLLDGFVVPRRRSAVAEIVTPLKPLEAMASGVPVLATDLPALRELTAGGSAGLLFEPDRPEALADACLALAGDAAAAQALARTAREHVERARGWDAAAGAYLVGYSTLGLSW